MVIQSLLGSLDTGDAPGNLVPRTPTRVDDAGGVARERVDLLRELPDGRLAAAAEVEDLGGLRVCSHGLEQAGHGIADVGEVACLLAGAGDRERLSTHREGE